MFAGAQALLLFHTETQRRIERETAERRQERIDLHLVRTEQQRLALLATRWETSDLVLAALTGLLDADELAPQDWNALVQAMGRLSETAGVLAAFGLSTSAEARTAIRLVQTFTSLSPIRQSMGMTIEDQARLMRDDNLALKRAELDARRRVRDLEEMFRDALACCEAGRRPLPVDLGDAPVSRAGRLLKDRLEAARSRPGESSVRHWAQRRPRAEATSAPKPADPPTA